ncbi:MAG: type II toxin-antitoxin system Phd/YefM family antitoxin [Elusimicrobia bacterium]|nr:type II toxin-antitoxin system Phd/YefM family antitoxin [Elusimicrobiota bacterium]
MTISQMFRAQHVGVKELKNHLSMFFKSHKPIIATDRGQPAYFLVPYENMVELIEMLEEAKDAGLARLVKSGRQTYAKGGWIPVSNLWKKLGA